MHGRTRTAAKPDPARVAAENRKCAQFAGLAGAMLRKHRAGARDGETLALNDSLLVVNPDVATWWNWRRLYIASGAGGGHPLEAELALTAAALRKNPKSYPTWAHRRWAVERLALAGGGSGAAVLAGELELCASALKLDERNFHCWGYRRWAAGAPGSAATPESELAFSREKIAANFSNYSAWHLRAALLSSPSRGGGAPSPWAEEAALVRDAIFTEPDDQAAWWYQRFVLSKATAATLAAEAEQVGELLQLEPECRLAAAMLADMLARLADVVGADKRDDVNKARRWLHRRLVRLDGLHAGFHAVRWAGVA